MTRRELAKRLSQDLRKRGLHYVNGTTVWKTTNGQWGAVVGLQKPPPDAAYYEMFGWDVIAERNSVLKIETQLRDLERKHDGTAKRVDRRSLNVK